MWHLGGDTTKLSADVIVLLDRVGAASRLHVSDISYWEVAVKAAKQRITLSMDVAVWLQRAERAPGIHFLPLGREILLLSTRLAGTANNDAADRLIVEYARSVPGTPVVDVRI